MDKWNVIIRDYNLYVEYETGAVGLPYKKARKIADQLNKGVLIYGLKAGLRSTETDKR